MNDNKGTKRPNVLFAIADDASHFGCFGHSFVKTPNIDRIAREGVLFENVFTPNPKCAPSRASILTGMHPWQLGAACNHNCYMPAGLTFIPDYLEKAGYRCGFTGKGWAPGDLKEGGYTRNPAGDAYNKYKITPPEGTAIRPFDYTRNFCDFLDSNPDGRPFWFWYGCREPHRPYVFGESLRLGKKSDDVDGDDLPSYWPDCPEVRQDFLDYAAEIEWYDARLGEMLDELENRGMLDDTIVIATSDNGCPFPRVKGQMFEQDFHLPAVAMWRGAGRKPGRRVSDMIGFVDIAPTMLDIAGVPKPDFMPGKSFLDAIDTDRDGQIDPGRTRVFFGREKQDVGREGDLGYPVRCLRDERFLYVRNFEPDRWPSGNPETLYTNCDASPTKTKIIELAKSGDDRYLKLAFGKRPAEQLFDALGDPECLCNLADDPEYSERLASMRRELLEALRQTGDPRLDDPGFFDRFPQKNDGCPHSWAAYLEGRFEPI